MGRNVLGDVSHVGASLTEVFSASLVAGTPRAVEGAIKVMEEVASCGHDCKREQHFCFPAISFFYLDSCFVPLSAGVPKGPDTPLETPACPLAHPLFSSIYNSHTLAVGQGSRAEYITITLN